MYTVTNGVGSVVAACTTFDAAADRAIALLERDIERDKSAHTLILRWYYVCQDGAELGVFGRDQDEPRKITFTPDQRAIAICEQEK
jgi:hypothetical protein